MDWDEYINENYDALVKKAKIFTDSPEDLVHHVYLRCRKLKFPNRPDGYFFIAMKSEATRGKFKKMYEILNYPQNDDIVEEVDDKYIMRERMSIVIDRLSWFDRNVLRLYLDGYKMVEVSESTGIPKGVLYQSIHKSKKILTNVLRKQ